MKCPKCVKTENEMSSSAQAYYEGIGVIPVHLCTKCGCAVPKQTYFDSPVVYAPYIPKFTEEQLEGIRYLNEMAVKNGWNDET